jgi:hypothetical protein
MVRSFMLVLMVALTLLSAPEVRAGRRHVGRRCRKDAQCLSGTCCNGRCSPQSACSNELAGLAALVTGGPGGELDAAPKPTGQGKPPAPEKCRNGFDCGTCGVCKKGRCTGGETGRCSSCQICSQDGSACIGVPDGSGSGPGGYYGCGPDALGGLQCCGGDCVDTRGNIDNCGACGNACTGGTSCQYMAGGGVGCRCRDWETECNGTCANLQTDPNNCGKCGHVCASGSCDNGVCECLSWCDGSGHCGGGQADCGPCETCNNGACLPTTCGGGQICCGAGCVDTQTDPSNCGACGTVCPAGQDCVQGACQSRCPPATTDCEGIWCCNEGMLCVHNEYTGAPLCCVPGFGLYWDCVRLGYPLICCMPQ